MLGLSGYLVQLAFGWQRGVIPYKTFSHGGSSLGTLRSPL
jgi:hypothetical protein